MKAFTIFALSLTSAASLIVIGQFVRSMFAEAKPAANGTNGSK